MQTTMMPSSSSSSRSFSLSSVTVAVDKATSELLLSPDWTMIIAICDSVNSNRCQCKDAIKAVKRRLQHKSSKVQMLTLTLLEALLKNCGDCVHSQIAEKHILQEMVKIVRKKGDFEVRNKILILLDTWNEAFSGFAYKYPHYNWAHQELLRSGVKFPERSREAALMLAPATTLPSLQQSSSTSLVPIGSIRRLDETMATEIESLSLSSLESMRNVMDLVNDMVQAVNPSDSSALKDELIVDLVAQCRSNQKKLIQMLTTTADEDVLARGLELNDALQVVLGRHDAISSGVSLPLLKTPETSDVKTAEPLKSSSSSSSSNESETDEEEVKNDFTQLSKSDALVVAEHYEGDEEEEEEEEEALLLGNINAKTEETEATKCKDLVLSDTTTTTTKAEQDIIELLSLTLSTTALPSSQSQTQTQTQPQMDPPSNNIHHHTSLSADDHIFMNSYVVPWAHSQPEPQVQFSPFGPQFQAEPQYVQPVSQIWPQQQQQQQQQFAYGYPQPPWSSQVNSNNTMMWNQSARMQQHNKFFDRNLQYSNSFPARAAGPSGTPVAEAAGQPQRPYVPPYKLFDDLNVYWNADGGVRSSK